MFSTFFVDPLWRWMALLISVLSSPIAVFLISAFLTLFISWFVIRFHVLLFLTWLACLFSSFSMELLEASSSHWTLFFGWGLSSWRRQIVVFSSGLWPLMIGAFWRGLNSFDLWTSRIVPCFKGQKNLYRYGIFLFNGCSGVQGNPFLAICILLHSKGFLRHVHLPQV
jgi:hypothetical protein